MPIKSFIEYLEDQGKKSLHITTIKKLAHEYKLMNKTDCDCFDDTQIMRTIEKPKFQTRTLEDIDREYAQRFNKFKTLPGYWEWAEQELAHIENRKQRKNQF